MTTQHEGNTIGLVELPLVELVDEEGRMWATPRKDTPLISKQVLMANLLEAGFKPVLINLKWGNHRHQFGEVTWKSKQLKKIFVGEDPFELDPNAYDAWGITINLSIQREVACLVIKHLSQGDRPIVVGGSDAIAVPDAYLQSGAAAIVLDKSGASNLSILQAVLGYRSVDFVTGAIFGQNSQSWKRAPRIRDIETWPLPSLEVIKACFGGQHFRKLLSKSLTPMGSILPDIGCDRHCDFCQTPSYQLGYRTMSQSKSIAWLLRQKQAGAGSVNIYSDQFLARVLRKNGRKETLEIMQGARDMGLPVLFSNGLELKKMSRGMGRNRTQNDLKPDLELVEALCGWDGRVGTAYLYVAGERPVFRTEKYDKLLPWQEHCEMMCAIVRAGVPYIGYGVIVGFEDETHQSLQRLEEAILSLQEKLLTINPALHFSFEPYALTIIPGTDQDRRIRQSGLMAFDDPTISGGFWTPAINSHELSYRDISDWQLRLVELCTPGPRAEYAFLAA